MAAAVPDIFGGDRKLPVAFKDFKVEGKGVIKNSDINSVCCSDESSSIGKNSDVSGNSLEKSEVCEEVQSSYKGPLNTMEALEQVLPIRRGISRFYNGKSKSYASLGDTSACSAEDIAKVANAYTRRRRNLLACSLTWDRTRSSPLRGNVIGGGIAKKVAATDSSRAALALAVAMRNSEGDKPGDFTASSWRSFSFADLQRCCTTTSNQSPTKLT